MTDLVADNLNEWSSEDYVWVASDEIERWDRFYLGLADYVATASKDPSTKVGAVIVRPDKTVASLGFNGFPRRMNDHPGLYADRASKYSRIIHAEINAILHAREQLAGYTLFCTHGPCDRCAVQIIQSGIKRVVAWHQPHDPAFKERWASIKLGQRYFEEAGVLYYERKRSVN